ncbi:glutamate receptor 2.2-like [Salvia miltiorrhiza]|uniref:glutamate receptor 2.2-like n=1 Tax=Salvia miltiorrhiza TaxID=226208 RepID=UPI0025AB7371|nr:glutamate receptor 2.2-like [Salvia miltiorrhiza]XP_057805578.1 glutamate receptor 2.2-like [Salvia miltiorrhiza]XP_057805579.1 glutamate receptor 2.2-like [Salvia miltiorrhiza]
MRCLSMALADFYSFHGDYKTRLVLHPMDSNGSVVDAAAAALHLLRDVKVDAMIGPQTSAQVNFVMDLGDKAHVPIISFSATSPSLVHQTPYFVQTAQSDANQVQAIASIVKALLWTQVVVIYEDTEFGNGIMPYLSNALQDVNARVPYRSVLPRSATDELISNELYKMMTMQTRVFVVHMSQFLGTKLFLKARELGMMTEGYVWIVTSGMTDLFSSISSDVAEAMQGVLGVRPLIPKSDELHSFASRLRQDNRDMNQDETSIFGLWAYDTLWALGMAAERVGISRSSATENETSVNFTSPFTFKVSETGPELLEALLDTRFRGLAGEFNLVKGQLKQTSYEIVNIVESIERPVGTWTPFSTSKAKFRSIIWPGDSTEKPRGWEYPIKGDNLRIAVPKKPGFNEFLKVQTDLQTNETKVSGYYKEVFDAVIHALPYALPYEFVPYPFIKPDGSRSGNYNDLVFQVSLQKDYDGALGDITITANRSDYADFTMPFAEGGIACIVPVKYEDVNDVLTFLQPLTIKLWLTTAILYISTAMATWFLAKRVVQSSRDSLSQQVGMSYLLPFFPGERIEVILICLILVTWALVANLLNSTYTANLSSRLTVANLRGSVANVEQLIAKGDYVGYQDGSFLEAYLIQLGFDPAKLKSHTSTEDCEQALSLGNKNNGTSAFCDVMPHIKAILSQACGKYKMINPVYRTDGFAFAFPKAFPAVADISKAIVQLTENGTIREIEKRHLPEPECVGPDGSSSLARVSLQSFSVLFAITGFVTVTCFLVSQALHLHNKRSLHQRVADFKANACSTIRRCFKPDRPSSPPATAEVEISSSNDHVIEVISDV